MPLAPSEFSDRANVAISFLEPGRRPRGELGVTSRWDEHPHHPSITSLVRCFVNGPCVVRAIRGDRCDRVLDLLEVDISDRTASSPRWAPGRRTLYFSNSDSIYAAQLAFDSTVTVLSNEALFARDSDQGRITDWTVHPDGGFMAIRQPPAPEAEEGDEEAVEVGPPRAYLVVNWVQEMLRRVGN